MKSDSQSQPPAGVDERVGVAERLGYAVGDTASCLFWQTFTLFLLNFYTDVYGLSAATAGTMLLVTRIWDTAMDPVMGGIADRTQSRYGRFRPWLLWGAGPFALAGILTFVTPPFQGTGKVIFAYVTYSLMMMTYTVVNIPYGALLGVISPSSKVRTQMSSYRMFGAFIGNLIVQGTLVYLVDTLGSGNKRIGFPLTMALYGVVAAGLFFFTFSSTRERVSPAPAQKSSAAQDIKDLIGNRPWLVLGLMSLVVLICFSIRGAVTIYYFKYYVHEENQASLFMVTGTIATLAGVAATSTVAGWLGGKMRAYVSLLLVNAICLGVFQLAGPTDIFLIYGTNIVGSFVGGPLFPLTWSMYADTADYTEWKTGRRSTGLIFSTATFAQKIGWTVGGSVAGWMLAAFGFLPNVEQSAEVLSGIRSMMGWIPAACCAAAAGIATLYNLDGATVLKLEAELRTRRLRHAGSGAGTGSAPKPEAAHNLRSPEPETA